MTEADKGHGNQAEEIAALTPFARNDAPSPKINRKGTRLCEGME
jgi:hypothetical protein